ncbi:MAG: patatin-like phospholipase family protein [Bacillota bacterium]|nr:patatin-like phospholipase family protein [Bacillota bacterium]
MLVKADAVFEGGGVKGIALAGAVTALEEEGYSWHRVAGASAGAITAALVAAGYSGSELGAILKSVDYSRLLGERGMRQFVLTKLIKLILKKGIYSTDYIERWVDGLLKKKGKQYFKDVYSDGEYKLKVIVSDITKRRVLILPEDLKEFGIDPAGYKISKAVGLSSSIPFFFHPGTLGRGTDSSQIVDGGLLSNFPVWIFDVSGRPRWPTFGFRLCENEKGRIPSGKKDLISYTLDIINTITDKNEEIYLRDKDAVRTMDIPTLGVKTTEFDITGKKAEALYLSGYHTGKAFSESWDFRRYIERYRLSQSAITKTGLRTD